MKAEPLKGKMFWATGKRRHYEKGVSFDANITFHKDIEAAVEFLKKRKENQLRIHWRWLKDADYKEVSNFMDAIINGAFKDAVKNEQD